MNWHLTDKGDPTARALADRHYSRQKPGSPQFVPPGRSLVLITPDHDALWVTSHQLYPRHNWPGAWVCSLFRNEGPILSSQLITEAVAATLALWGPNPHGFLTFVNPSAIKPKRSPGQCFRQAGWQEAGVSKRRLLVALTLSPDRYPEPKPPRLHRPHPERPRQLLLEASA